MIRANVKRLVRSIYVMRCGYCLLSEVETGAGLTFDHFRPPGKGGSDEVDNLVYACHACNEFKGEYYGDADDTRLLHPLQDDLILHIRQEANCTLRGITRAGQRYIEQLKLNRQPLVLHRQSQVREEQIAGRLDVIGARVDQILKRIQAIDKSRQRGA